MENERYVITEKGKLNSAACESSLPYSVRRRCDEDLAPINAALRREAQVRGEKRSNADGSVTARLALDDASANLMTLELLCPDEARADQLINVFRAKPEQVFHAVLQALAGDSEEEK